MYYHLILTRRRFRISSLCRKMMIWQGSCTQDQSLKMMIMLIWQW